MKLEAPPAEARSQGGGHSQLSSELSRERPPEARACGSARRGLEGGLLAQRAARWRMEEIMLCSLLPKIKTAVNKYSILSVLYLRFSPMPPARLPH